MRRLASLALMVFLATPGALLAAAGKHVTYQVDGAAYEGYYVAPSPDAPLVLLIHDWDGLTDYEVQRADTMSCIAAASRASSSSPAARIPRSPTRGISTRPPAS